MTTTPNLGLTKDDPTERYDVERVNLNSDRVDAFAGETRGDIGVLQTAVAGKQNQLTFDTAPTDGSANPVTSGGIYTAVAAKVDTTTYEATRLIYEDTGNIQLSQLTWTRTSGASGVWIADAYDVKNIDTIVSVIITGFGQFKPAEFDLFFVYVPSSVTGMHRIRVVADADLSAVASSPYVAFRVFGYGQQ